MDCGLWALNKGTVPKCTYNGHTMIIVVNHLTRMREGRICVAGVEPESGRHVRPVTKWGQIDGRLLAGRSLDGREGPFNMAHVVDLGHTTPDPQKPHVEDHAFVPWKARFIERLRAEDFWALLYRMSRPSLKMIFGDELRLTDRQACGLGTGDASLGILRPVNRPRIYLRREKNSFQASVRMCIDDGQLHVDVGVTDLRLFCSDHISVNETMVERVERRLQGTGPVLLGMGLGRAFAPPSEKGSARHWLQVNNIHFEENPIWGFVENARRFIIAP